MNYWQRFSPNKENYLEILKDNIKKETKKMTKIDELREKAMINRRDKGIFENYSDFEIKKLTTRQICNMLKAEEIYKNYKKGV